MRVGDFDERLATPRVNAVNFYFGTTTTMGQLPFLRSPLSCVLMAIGSALETNNEKRKILKWPCWDCEKCALMGARIVLDSAFF